ncbi:MAG: hypothetical protein IT427_15745 [Pirellulales bacterium]|nr:hypothetical protein [Pirellulales bacterium]
MSLPTQSNGRERAKATDTVGSCRSVGVSIELPNNGPPAAAKPGLGLGGMIEH